MRINLSLSSKDLEELNKLSKHAGLTRSEFIRKLIEFYKAEAEIKRLEEARRKELADAVRVQERLSSIAGKWDGVSQIRKWRDSR
ncbi:MAG: ribbon-helix-helix protein, CopG family [Actinobacteria bacterium]|nr:ribbon-helix-helix protein, CopG family [Actinomycetota bacterium]